MMTFLRNRNTAKEMERGEISHNREVGAYNGTDLPLPRFKNSMPGRRLQRFAEPGKTNRRHQELKIEDNLTKTTLDELVNVEQR